MSIKVITPADRAEWLAHRRLDVTASQIAALVNVHPFLTPFELYLDKIGALGEPEQTPAMERGRRLEPIAVDLIRQRLPDASVTANGDPPTLYYRDTVARIGATPDVLVSDPERGLGVVQIKTIEPSTFRRAWRPDGETIEPPLWIGLQSLTEAKLIPSCQWAAVAAMRVGFGIEFDLIDVPLHPGAWDRLVESVADFWRLVERREPPPPDYNRDGKLIASLYPLDAGTSLDLTHDNAFVHAVAERRRFKEMVSDLETAIDALDAEIRHKAGPAQTIVAGDLVVSLKTEHRKAYSVAAGTRRPLKIKQRAGIAA